MLGTKSQPLHHQKKKKKKKKSQPLAKKALEMVYLVPILSNTTQNSKLLLFMQYSQTQYSFGCWIGMNLDIAYFAKVENSLLKIL